MTFGKLFNLTRVYMDESGEGGNGAAPVAAAPAPAPTPAPATSVVTEQAPAAADAPTERVFNETGNQKVDYALEVIGKAGITQEHPAVKAAVESGDFSMLQHSLEAAGVPGAAGLVTMLQAEYEADYQRGEEVIRTIQSDVAAIAGGEEQWNEVAGFIRDNGTDEELDVLREMLGNPKMHKIAATYMTNLYNSAGGVKEPVGRVESDVYTPRAGQTKQAPLSRREFAAEVDALHRKHGSAFEQTPEYRALAARLAR